METPEHPADVARAWSLGLEPPPDLRLAPSAPAMAPPPKSQREPRERGGSRWQVTAVGLFTAVVAFGLAAYAAAASYESVSRLAAAHHVPLPGLNPLGIDGGLLGVIAISISLFWLGTPLRWLRLTGRLFAAGTVAANAAAGWPDPVGVGLRIAAPALFVVITEAAYAILVHRSAEADEAIPFARWLLAFPSTFRLWRRMRLWRIRSYPEAVAMELARRRAIVRLRARYGDDWRTETPADLMWMLRRGVHMEEALAMVAELTAPQPEPEPVSPPRKPARNRKPATTRKPTRKPASAPARKTALPSTPEPDLDTESQALAILAREPGISGSQLGLRLGKTDRYGRMLLKQLTVVTPGPDAGESAP